MAENEPRSTLCSSDDFGDDDFDTDMVEALDISPHETETSTSLMGRTTGSIEATNQPMHPPPPDVATSKDAGSDDEFGMGDEDDFAADLEHVASLYDTRDIVSPTEAQTSIVDTGNVATSHAPVTVIDLIEDDSDEFGEDIDVDEFAAAEVAATQVTGNTVRRLRTFP